MNRTIRYELNGISFEWNIEKAARNRLQRGIPFELACEVFFDPFHVVRHEEVIRIISARRATAEERRIYEQF